MDSLPPTNDSTTNETKKVRGMTKCKDVNDLPPGSKMKVDVHDKQPVGDKATKLANYCGTLVRDNVIVPIDKPSWHKVDPSVKQRLWIAVKSKFELDDSMADFVFKSLGKKWRNYKRTLKRDYYEAALKLDKDPLNNKPKHVIELVLVSYWNTPLAKVKSQRNKESRGKHKLPHTSGTKSIARVRHDQRIKNKCEPSRRTIFKITHVSKNGLPVNTAAKEVIDKMDETFKTQPEGTEDVLSLNDVYAQVMGPERNGRVRCMGLGLTPTQVFGSSSKNDGSLMQLDATREELEKVVAEKVVAMEVELAAKAATMEAEMVAKTAAMEKQFEEQLAEKTAALEAQMAAKNAEVDVKLQAFMHKMTTLTKGKK